MMKNQSTLQFLDLLRSGLWGTSLNLELFQGDIDWKNILTISERQTVIGNVFDGIINLPPDLQPPTNIMLKLVYFINQIEKTHTLLNKELSRVLSALKDKDISSILLKGQGVAHNYKNPLRRQCGDIDLYVGLENCERAKEVLLSLGAKQEHEESKSPKHLNFSLNGVDIELHFLVEKLRSQSSNEHFQFWVENHFQQNKLCKWQCNNVDIQIPSADFNAFYIFHHAYHHFTSEGLGLRQFCDWIMILQQYQSLINQSNLLDILNKTNLLKIWQIFGYISVNYLGLAQESFPFYTDKYTSEGKKAMKIILQVGNFGVNRYSKNKRPSNYFLGKVYSSYYIHKYLFNIFSIAPKDTYRYGLYHWKEGLSKTIKGF